ncbi:helix-turn-helix domain-containing protein [Streptomyces sp. JV185]|uniref:ArsR/SmtB family transcription factor n=1 Tax=Streptomyces sp. JV185 TaxID=858638 RepID=UPI002E7790A1|nr:helix-turn-helix domain-containing protein [Streptomyces sp. JV185]MEE1771655.1 helix-turn-helix domain-containing protein [Streptomyces sp. JV185]
MSAEDLTCIRIGSGLGPEIEAIFALEVLQGSATHFQAWRNDVCERLSLQGDLAARLDHLVRMPGVFRDVLRIWTGDRCMASGENTMPFRSHAEARELVRDFCRVAMAPGWPEIQARIDTETDACRQIAGSAGVKRLLSSLHPRIRWQGRCLEIPADGPREVVPDGRGLVLAPSLFLQSAGEVLVNAEGAGNGVPTLAFPVRFDPRREVLLTGESDGAVTARDRQRSLGALVGRTRAALLRALLDESTTSELADSLGVTAAAVSQHAAVLRSAGLITSRRSGSSVLHTVTMLGLHLLRGESARRAGRRTASGAGLTARA